MRFQRACSPRARSDEAPLRGFARNVLSAHLHSARSRSESRPCKGHGSKPGVSTPGIRFHPPMRPEGTPALCITRRRGCHKRADDGLPKPDPAASGHGNHHFRLQTPGQRPGGSESVSGNPKKDRRFARWLWKRLNTDDAEAYAMKCYPVAGALTFRKTPEDREIVPHGSLDRYLCMD